ncbi:uncharacterized protein LOC129594738 [Paramacrobiotus metropolitanus]|uniref:uncharacterized protein LOC129594738 n=1 Tax=Paramacrobiotus metropolitanus TaxID=2943436 RepID=UPI002445BAE0|nr:uncharacterized protein LOC129594738 [Paramacrobiotus metropolitanus]
MDMPQVVPSVAAPRPIAAGEIVAQSEAWVWSFHWDKHQMLCAHCFKFSDHLLATCSKCKLYYYCGAKCLKDSWKKEHNLECDMLKRLRERFSGARISDLKNVCPASGQDLGIWTNEIILLKILNKIQRKADDHLPGAGTKKTTIEILDALPYKSEFGKTKKSDLGLYKTLHALMAECLGVPVESMLVSVKEMRDYHQKVFYSSAAMNSFEAAYPFPFGAGIFPTVNHRQLTPVCSDSNVTLTFHGRFIKIMAIDDIPEYRGLQDCRSYGHIRRPLGRTAKQRQDLFRKHFNKSCECRKCSSEYDADINPLKCSTTGCAERIPSDERALNPCSQCGAINGQQLQAFRRLSRKQEKVFTEHLAAKNDNFHEALPLRIRLLKELDDSGLVHPEAHLRYVYGWDAADQYTQQKRFPEAWELYAALVPCVRTVFPEYHLQRAQHLQNAGIHCHAWFTIESMLVSPNDRARFLSHFEDVLPTALDFLQESSRIYAKVYGSDSTMVKTVREQLNNIEDDIRLLKSEVAVREEDPERFAAVSENIYGNITVPELPAHLTNVPQFEERSLSVADSDIVVSIFQRLLPNSPVDWKEMAGFVWGEDGVTTARYYGSADGYYKHHITVESRGSYWSEEPDDFEAKPFSLATMINLTEHHEKACVQSLMAMLEEKYGWGTEVMESRAKFADLFEGKLGKIGWMICELVNTPPVLSSALFEDVKDNIDKAVSESKPFAVDRHLVIAKAHLPVGRSMRDAVFANDLEELWYKNAQASYVFPVGGDRNYISQRMRGKKLVPIRVVMLLDAKRLYKMIKDLTHG